MKKWFTRYRDYQRFKAQPLPMVTMPYRAALEKTQRQYVFVLILTLIILGYYSYHYFQAQAKAEKSFKVAVASGDLALWHVVKDTDVTLIDLPHKWRPPSAFSSSEAVVGQTLIQVVSAQEIIVQADVSKLQNPDSITAQFSDDFAFTVGEDWFVSKLPALVSGDRINVIAMNPKSEAGGSLTVANNLEVIEQKSLSGRKNLVLKVTPEEANNLLASRGLRLPMQVLVHSRLPNSLTP